MVAGTPGHGGATWSVLQYLLGFRRLGHDVFLVEPVREAGPETLDYFARVVGGFGLEDRAALLLGGTDETVGTENRQVRKFAESSDVLINVSGMLRDPRLTEPIGSRVYLDLDPAFNQLWHDDGHRHGLRRAHTLRDRGSGDRAHELPRSDLRAGLDSDAAAGRARRLARRRRARVRGADDGRQLARLRLGRARRRPLRPEGPLVPPLLRAASQDRCARLRWRWRSIRTRARISRRCARTAGSCSTRDEVAGTPAGYRRFIQGSWAELGIAKSGYVVSRCGWFSDRSVCYLASGRPVIAQETGFSGFLPTGEGLMAFETVDDVLGGVEELRRDYEGHRRSARAIAEDVFDSDKVLSRLLDAVGGS